MSQGFRVASFSLALMASPLVACADAGCSSQEVAEEKPASTGGEFPVGDPALPGVTTTNDKLVKELASALKKKGSGYKPRTHHFQQDGTPEFTNRLILETSPYLLQHAHNPVNWRAWTEEAFARAKKENKPILLSVGYSTCHWCHVMERESFEDKEIAAFINQHFVAIKVDREERPDIDDIYMRAVRVLSGRGGWPMTVIMTPEKDPFFGGTYIPARDGDRGSRQGFLTLLKKTSEEFNKDPSSLIAKAQQTSQRVMAAAAPARPGALPAASVLNRASSAYLSRFDAEWGGFGRAPKFPRPSSLDFLLRHFRVLKKTNQEKADKVLSSVLVTLDKMATGGMFDQVGGGFHRYSTDTRWLVPHFEKMLYDNGQLVAVYLDAYQITGNEFYATVARRTLDYVIREMTSPEGAFYSATDADSLVPGGHMEEGYFFTWTPAELSAVLSEDELKATTVFYSVKPGGNFEGRSIFHVAREPQDVAKELSIDGETLESRLRSARQRLYLERSKRPAPGLDDKILTSWNGLMISGFARGAAVLGEKRYLDAAKNAADYLLKQARGKEGLLRTTREGVSKQRGFLDDYAFFIGGLLDLFQAGNEAEYFRAAVELEQELDAEFLDKESGGYFKTGANHEELLARDKPSYDGAEPSGNSVMADNLLRIASMTADHGRQERAEGIFQALASELNGSIGAPRMMAALQSYYGTSLQVIVVEADRAEASPMTALARKSYLPGALVLTLKDIQADKLAREVELLSGKRARKKSTAYVCERGRCQLPAKDIETFTEQLSKYL